MSKGKILLVVGIGLAVAAFFAFDLGRFFDLAFIKAQQSSIEAFREDQPLLTAALFFVVYVAVTGLSLPGAAIMTLVAGAIFGLAWGTLIVSFASSIGATLAFLASRLISCARSTREWRARGPCTCSRCGLCPYFRFL